MPMWNWTSGARSVAILMAVSGCAKNESAPRDAGAATVPVGLDDPSNQAPVVALARAALGCSWREEEGLDEKCPAAVNWRSAGEVKAETAVATLLAMLSDRREPVRWLAGVALAVGPRALYADAASAKRVVEAARRERHPRVGRELGFAVGALDLRATKLEPEVRDLIARHPVPFVRLAIVARTLEGNPSMFDVVAGLVRSERDDGVQRAAMDALRSAPTERRAEAGTLLLEATGKPELGDWAAWSCAQSEPVCGPRWDEMLTKLEGRRDRATSFMVYALESLHRQPKATSAQRARVEKLALAIVQDDAGDDIARSKAIDTLGRIAPTAARAMAAKYKGDDRTILLQRAAEEIFAGGAADAGRDAH